MQEKYRGRGASSRGFVPRIGKKRKFVGDATQVSGRVVALPQASHPYPSTITPIRTHIQYISYIKTLNIHYTAYTAHTAHAAHKYITYITNPRKYYIETDESPTQRLTQPNKKKRFKEVAFWATFPPNKSKYFFLRFGLIVYRKQTTRIPTQTNSPQTPY